ncbi:MAG: hypothetical protein JSV45_09665 [Chromatiales bacterium]|nr:MAG: hypothetical protein JSV45_09665 [Chromatiales bacterium]
MSEKDPIRVFVSHLFEADIDYLRVFEYMESRGRFFYINTARPDDIPTEGGQDPMKAALLEQIQAAEILVLPVVTFERNPDLVRYQMDAAQAKKMPILAVRSFGGTVAIPKEVLDRCDDLVEWNDRVITDAIRRLARNEDTAKWEVIEFDPD